MIRGVRGRRCILLDFQSLCHHVMSCSLDQLVTQISTCDDIRNLESGQAGKQDLLQCSCSLPHGSLPSWCQLGEWFMQGSTKGTDEGRYHTTSKPRHLEPTPMLAESFSKHATRWKNWTYILYFQEIRRTLGILCTDLLILTHCEVAKQSGS